MTRGLSLTMAAVLGAGALTGAQDAPFRYETQKPDAYAAERGRVVAGALGVSAWPRTSELYAPPPVSRALLRDAGRVADEVRACTTVSIEGEAWPQCTWSWKAAKGERTPVGYDWLDLQITQAPSSRAAHESLVASLADNMLPTERLEAQYKAAARPENLGTVALETRSPQGGDVTLSFVRGNLVFRIRGYGALAGEARPLAARLDESVLNQQPLTIEELRARRAK
ncbi:MAG: hypothetical protein ABW221_06065 [Vicinamibacteria bacterium]